ncbi:MAG TPA: SDR family NAD(P)-dependent oxidoreductase [Myxococcota bacterium]|nr:SDR family NAD(P)-dependent oxidoreductase [Myxococcota bacterium]
MRRFEGKAALVTGAASGIGRATALRLASEGATIHGADVDEAGLAETASLVQSAGGKMTASRHDLTKRDACFAAVEAAHASQGRLDVLGNIAGISRFHLFEELPESDWNLMLAVNLSAVLWTSQAALPYLVETKGAIVNVASVAGLIGQAYTVAYCATKGGVVQLTRALAMEYITRGVRVNAVAPGGVDTPMNRTMHFPKAMDWKLVKPYMGRRGMAQPEEIAAAIAYLASDEARFVHGAILSIDGGVAAG